MSKERRKGCEKCKRHYGYGNMGSSHVSQAPLVDGICVDCLPVAHSCSHDSSCEWDRFISHTGAGCEHLFKLRLCDVHRARFEEGKR